MKKLIILITILGAMGCKPDLPEYNTEEISAEPIPAIANQGKSERVNY